MSLLFAFISLVLALADGSDLNPHSKAYYASPCGKWTFRRAFIKSALPLIAAALPNYIHLRVCYLQSPGPDLTALCMCPLQRMLAGCRLMLLFASIQLSSHSHVLCRHGCTWLC